MHLLYLGLEQLTFKSKEAKPSYLMMSPQKYSPPSLETRNFYGWRGRVWCHEQAVLVLQHRYPAAQWNCKNSLSHNMSHFYVILYYVTTLRWRRHRTNSNKTIWKLYGKSLTYSSPCKKGNNVNTGRQRQYHFWLIDATCSTQTH